MTELVDRDAIHRHRQDQRFLGAEWNQTKLREALAERITAKDRPERVRGGSYEEYFLIIHTDEPFLDFDVANEWLEGYRFGAPRLISRAYLLFSYYPSPPHYRFIRLHWGTGA